MGYEAILFDMDGVIVDTYQSVAEFWQNLAEAYQVHLITSVNKCQTNVAGMGRQLLRSDGSLLLCTG